VLDFICVDAQLGGCQGGRRGVIERSVSCSVRSMFLEGSQLDAHEPYSSVQCVAVHMQCVVVYCSVSLCVAVCCSVLQCDAVCCTVL